MPEESSTSLSTTRDDELLVRIASAGDGREAWGELYRRHAEYVYRRCVRAVPSSMGGSTEAQEIVAKTFLRILEGGAASFEPGQYADDEQSRRHVRAWIGRVAHRVLQQAQREQARRQEARLEIDHWNDMADDRETTPIRSGDAELMGRLLDSVLDDRDREIVRVKMMWYEPGKRSHPPPDVMEALCGKLGMKEDAVRQRYSRAIRKLGREFKAARAHHGT